MSRFIPLSIPNFEGNEKKYVDNALEQGWVSTGGAYIKKLEENMAKFLQIENVAACQSGTSALHLALVEAGVKTGDVVIVPTLTFIAAVNPVRYQFATPVFMDCDDSFCMDPVKLKRFCEEECIFENGCLKYNGQIVKALIVVHVFGNMADMESIMDIAHKYGMKVIEDATEALGTYYTEGKYTGKYAGTIGDFGAYSFNGNKIVTTSGGGMALSDDPEAIEKIHFWSNQSKENVNYYLHNEIGYNYRMSNICAGIGRGQLKNMDERIAARVRNYEFYKKTFADLPVKMAPVLDGCKPNFWLSVVTINEDCDVTPDEIIKELEDNNIESRRAWNPMHNQPIFSEMDFISCKQGESVGNDIFRRGVCLPSGTAMTEEDLERVASVFRGAFENK